MKVRRLIVLFALSVIVCFVGAKQGLAYMQATYSGACVKLDGFPGLLQEMNFLAKGDCEIKKGTTNTCQNNGSCTVSGPSGTNKGKCNDVLGVCTCVVDSD